MEAHLQSSPRWIHEGGLFADSLCHALGLWERRFGRYFAGSTSPTATEASGFNTASPSECSERHGSPGQQPTTAVFQGLLRHSLRTTVSYSPASSSCAVGEATIRRVWLELPIETRHRSSDPLPHDPASQYSTIAFTVNLMRRVPGLLVYETARGCITNAGLAGISLCTCVTLSAP